MARERGGLEHGRRFVALAALVAVVLVAIVLIAQYGMHSLDRTVARSQAEIDRVADMAERARVAQVSFKTEVQEWKNVLIRGHEPEDFAAYRAALQAREADVDATLAALEADAAAVGFETATLSALATAHVALAEAYDGALAGFSAEDPLSIRRVDAAVRGQDRPINDGFDMLVTEVRAFAEARRTALREEVVAVSIRMQNVLYVSLGIGVVVLALAAFTAMRRGRAA